MCMQMVGNNGNYMFGMTLIYNYVNNMRTTHSDFCKHCRIMVWVVVVVGGSGGSGGHKQGYFSNVELFDVAYTVR